MEVCDSVPFASGWKSAKWNSVGSKEKKRNVVIVKTMTGRKKLGWPLLSQAKAREERTTFNPIGSSAIISQTESSTGLCWGDVLLLKWPFKKVPTYTGTNWEESMETRWRERGVWKVEEPGSAEQVREDLCRRVREEKNEGRRCVWEIKLHREVKNRNSSEWTLDQISEEAAMKQRIRGACRRWQINRSMKLNSCFWSFETGSCPAARPF